MRWLGKKKKGNCSCVFEWIGRRRKNGRIVVLTNCENRFWNGGKNTGGRGCFVIRLFRYCRKVWQSRISWCKWSAWEIVEWRLYVYVTWKLEFFKKHTIKTCYPFYVVRKIDIGIFRGEKKTLKIYIRNDNLGK